MKKIIKRRYYILLNTLLIFFISIILVIIYTKKTTNKINDLMIKYFEKEVTNNITNVLKKVKIDNPNDILKIYKNSQGEILYIDYDINNAYKLLNEVSIEIKNNMQIKEYPNNGIIVKLPFNVKSNNIFFTNLGPKITIKINYIDSVLSNINTKVTNYGLNNALVELYIKITIEGQIISPVNDKQISTNYDMLIASKIINGRVPEVYGNYLTSSSSILDVPIK